MAYVYLASPYSHTNLKVQQDRYDAAAKWVANHLSLYRNPAVYSPIIYAHNIAVRHKLPTDAKFWFHFNYNMMQHAAQLWVLQLPGWQISKGIVGDPDKDLVGELDLAKQLNKEIKFIKV